MGRARIAVGGRLARRPEEADLRRARSPGRGGRADRPQLPRPRRRRRHRGRRGAARHCPRARVRGGILPRLRRARRRAEVDLPHHPKPGEFGNETWENDSWRYTGNTGVWAPMSADHELGDVYLAAETPTNDLYGGHRPGDNLFADSLVCPDARTGERVWHYQLIHHGIWDYDIPTAPTPIVPGEQARSPVPAIAEGVYGYAGPQLVQPRSPATALPARPTVRCRSASRRPPTRSGQTSAASRPPREPARPALPLWKPPVRQSAFDLHQGTEEWRRRVDDRQRQWASICAARTRPAPGRGLVSPGACSLVGGLRARADAPPVRAPADGLGRGL